MEQLDVATNPYAPPAANVDDVTHVRAAPAIWNPNAAANWSLIFSPVFGAFLHMRNWEALNEPKRAAIAKGWVVTGVLMLVLYVWMAISLPDSKSVDKVTRLIGFVYLLVWYFAAARGQSIYVKERFGKDYPRKGWGKPILIALGALIGYMAIAGVAGYIMAIVRPA